VGTAGVQFRPDVDTMIYASVTRGYKGAAIDTTIGSRFFTGGADSAVLDPEIVLSYELGLKTSTLNNRLLFSGTVFYSEFDDFQATSFDGTSFVLRNAGVLESQGVEVDITASLWEGGTLNFSGAYVDATFDEYTGAPCTVGQVASGACQANGGVQDLSGEPLNNNAEWQYTVNFRQDASLGGVGVYFLGEYAWTDEVVFDGDLDPNTTQDAFGLANFKLGAVFADTWDIALFARNAFDEDYSLRTADAPLYTGAYGLYPALDRMIGVELRADF
jgi:iron complex outermembrane receptor protein